MSRSTNKQPRYVKKKRKTKHGDQKTHADNQTCRQTHKQTTKRQTKMQTNLKTNKKTPKRQKPNKHRETK